MNLIFWKEDILPKRGIIITGKKLNKSKVKSKKVKVSKIKSKIK